MREHRYRNALAAILTVALIARLALVFLMAPTVGYAGDMDLFLEWGRGLVQHGPWRFYADVADTNYPPLAIWLTGGLYAIADAAAGLLGSSPDHIFMLLLKVPSVLADVGSAAIIARLVRRHGAGASGGEGAALVAAAIYLLLPVVWYDSALWGQFDSIVAFGSLAALALLVSGRAMLAEVTAILTMLFKPQGVLVVIVVTTVIVVTHLRRDDAGRRRVGRLLATGAVATATLIAVLAPFDLQRLAGSPWDAVPPVGSIVGFVSQSVSTAALYPVLTANAFNVWALVGNPSLASSIHAGHGSWLPDSVAVLDMPANLLGASVLGLAAALVVIGLVGRSDCMGALFAFTVLSVAFFAFPTRVHERYLVPAFATATVLAAGVLWRLVALGAIAVANTINLHAVLALGSGHATGAAGDISLPFRHFARTQPVVTATSVIQSGVGVALVVAWFVFVARSESASTRPPAPPSPT